MRVTADFLTQEIPVYIATLGYLWVAVACILWAIDLFAAGWNRGCTIDSRFPILIRRWFCFFTRFETWLALFLMFGDAVLYGVLGLIFIRSDEIDLWAFAIMIVGAITASGAYISWANEALE